jgi:hypothetical protein
LLGQAHELRCLILIVLRGGIVVLGTPLATLLIVVAVFVGVSAPIVGPPTPALQASVKALLLGRASKTSQIRSVALLGRRSIAADVGQVSLLALR